MAATTATHRERIDQKEIPQDEWYVAGVGSHPGVQMHLVLPAAILKGISHKICMFATHLHATC
jgi:hypothetical protein